MSRSKQKKDEFANHIARIRVAKKAATLIEQVSIAEQSMGLLWENLFDKLCVSGDEQDWKELKILSDVLRKTIQSYQSVKTLANNSNSDCNDARSWELTEDVISAIDSLL